MKILFFMGVYLPRPGGVPRNTHNMVMALRKKGADVRVFAPHEKGDSELSLPYHVYRYHRFPVKRLFTRSYIAGLMLIKKEWPFDLIHCHGIDPTAYCASFYKGLTGSSYIVTPRRSNIFKKEKHFFHRRRNRRIHRALCMADRITVLSHEIERIILGTGVNPDKIVRIPHGIDPAPFKDVAPVERERPYILALGRLVACKGFDILIEAYSQICQKHPDIDLVIVGSGPKERELRNQIRSKGLDQRIILAGRKEGREKIALLKGATAFVFPSRPGNEGFPNVILEAMAAGLPIITTRVSGAEDIVIPDYTGYIVPPENINSLASALNHILVKPGLIKKQNIETHLGNYLHEKIMQRYLDLYQDLIRKKHRH